MKTALYRHYDEDGVLLYVGISLSVTTRLATHMRDAGWSGEIKTVGVQHYNTRAEAMRAETTAIIFEKPQWNKTHNLSRSVARAPDEWESRDTQEAHLGMAMLGIKQPSAMTLFHFLSSKVAPGTNRATITKEWISRRVGLSPRTISGAISALKKEGYVRVAKESGKDVYQVHPSFLYAAIPQ